MENHKIMGNFDRIERIVKSWAGKLKRDRYYQQGDMLMILNDLGMQISPKTLEWLLANNAAQQEIEMGLYAAEDKFGKSVVLEDSTIDPTFSPKVYDEEGRFALSLTHNGKEYVVVDVMTFS